MRSKIIQLETKPIVETGKTTANGIILRNNDNWFLENVADSIFDNDNREETITEFIKYLQAIGPFVDLASNGQEQWIVFHEDFAKAYFAKIYPAFQEALRNLVNNASLDALCGHEMETLLYPLQKMVEDRFGVYIDSEETGLRTINAFIRDMKPNKKYYIGGTVDYKS